MKRNPKISAAVAAILAASATAARAAEPTTGEAATETTGIGEVVVTAQRRVENAQDVPITIQALTSETLSQMKVQTFEDVARFLPNVTQGTYGPGQNLIYIRGLGTGALGVQGEGSVGIFPNVAVYLDDIVLPGMAHGVACSPPPFEQMNVWFQAHRKKARASLLHIC